MKYRYGKFASEKHILMKHSTNKYLSISYCGTRYHLRIESQKYTDSITVSKLVLGDMRLWLILQDSAWRLISDMPLCEALKKTVIKKLMSHFDLELDKEIINSEQACLQAGIKLSRLLSSIALKKNPL